MVVPEKDNIRLRELRPADKPRLAQLANNKKIWDNVRDFFPFPCLKKNAIDFIAICNKEDPKVTFAIEYQGDLTGVAGLVLQTDIYRKSAEIGYWVGEPYWNKGIATSAVILLINYGFEKLTLERIFTGVFEHNKASQRILEKCGFIHEGIFKNAIIKNNRVLDEYRYGITKNQHKAL
ncbi:putative ribosomal N-acetyltransferase YdaF [subsurface metagenome]